MGLLKIGVPQTFPTSKPNLPYIRRAGILQFISTFNRVKNLSGDELLWGDEVEYQIYKLTPDGKKVELSLRSPTLLAELTSLENTHKHRLEGCNWVPEYGAWMIEATPSRPYTGYADDLLRVERNMRLRRKRILSVLKEGEIAPTVSAYPLLGVEKKGRVGHGVGGPVTESEYISDEIINPHPRFATLTRNIRLRRGSKVNIRVPLFRDVSTPEYLAPLPSGGDCGGCPLGTSFEVWRYGKGDASYATYGKEYLTIACSNSNVAEGEAGQAEMGITLQKYEVNVVGGDGLFYRSLPGVTVADADWPRNGEVVQGSPVRSGRWIKLQNGYYLPMRSEDGEEEFLKKISHDDQMLKDRVTSDGMNRMGSPSPKLRPRNSSGSKIPTCNMGNIDEEVLAERAAKLSVDGDADGDGDADADAPPPPPASPSSKSKECGGPHSINQILRPAIHMDAMAFGMGMSCLQVTFQAQELDESRFIYDQLAVLAPIMMVLTASTPLLKGRIADTDCRWGVISEAVDDRTERERELLLRTSTKEEFGHNSRKDSNASDSDSDDDEFMAGKGKRRLYKSRYDSISTYIYQGACNPTGAQNGGDCGGCGGVEDDDEGDSSGSNISDKPAQIQNRVLNKYNDLPVPIDEEHYLKLRQEGIDPALAQHVAHLFIRDPLTVFDGSVEEVDDETQTEHFENIQSTNWQSVRWKPPPPRLTPNDPHIGWRVELRTMEMQLTDFENAAFSVFSVLVTRVILAFDLNLYIPLSRVDVNMNRAHSRDAINKGRFFFRRHLAPLEEGDDGFGKEYDPLHVIDGENKASATRKRAPCATGGNEENSFEEMTINEIMNGKGDHYPGLIPLVYAYLDLINCDSLTMERVGAYLEMIKKRSTGELMTPAAWMRKYVRDHPAYKKDSVVSEEICFDLLTACKEIGEGTRECPEILGNVKIEQITSHGAFDVKMELQKKITKCDRNDLIRRYTRRNSFSVE